MHAIACIGDSIVFGRGEELPNIGWVGRLKEYHEKQDSLNWVYNLGIPGDTSRGLVERIDMEIRQRKPGGQSERFSVIISIGTNDTKADRENGKAQISIVELKNNINKIIKISRKYADNVVFVGLLLVDEDKVTPIEEDKFYYNNKLEEYNKVIKEICEKEDIVFIELFSSWIRLNYKELLMDGIHPSTKGYELMFKEIKNRLLKEKIIH